MMTEKSIKFTSIIIGVWLFLVISHHLALIDVLDVRPIRVRGIIDEQVGRMGNTINLEILIVNLRDELRKISDEKIANSYQFTLNSDSILAQPLVKGEYRLRNKFQRFLYLDFRYQKFPNYVIKNDGSISKQQNG